MLLARCSAENAGILQVAVFMATLLRSNEWFLEESRNNARIRGSILNSALESATMCSCRAENKAWGETEKAPAQVLSSDEGMDTLKTLVDKIGSCCR